VEDTTEEVKNLENYRKKIETDLDDIKYRLEEETITNFFNQVEDLEEEQETNSRNKFEKQVHELEDTLENLREHAVDSPALAAAKSAVRELEAELDDLRRQIDRESDARNKL